MADDYITGHKPPETYAQLVSRLNAGAFFLKDHTPKLPKNRKRDKITEAASKLGEAQLALLLKLLKGEAIRILIGGEPYAAWKTPDGWAVQSMTPDGETRYVVGGRCSCPQNNKLDKHCKHLKAVEALK